MPRLIVKATPSHADSLVELSRLRTTLGRSARNDLCVEDPFASRLHAEVRRRGDRYWLSDLGSANGTLLNGSRLLTAAQLQDGDQIRVGETEIEYSERADTAPARSRTSVLVSDAFQPPAPEVMIDAESQAPASKLMSVIDTSSKTQVGTVIGRADVLPDQSLAIISRVSLTLLSQLSLNDTLIQVLDSVFQALPADRGYIMLLEPAEEQPATKDKKAAPELELVCKAMKTRTPSPETHSEVKLSRSITEQVLKLGKAVLTSDAQHDPRFQERRSIVLGGIRSVMAVPLAVEGRVAGMIYVDSPFGVNRFTEHDLQLLTLIGGVAAIRIENMRLLEDQQEKNRLAEEVALASEIQLRLHPATSPPIGGFDLVGMSFPCYEVGGDYYDFIERRDGRVVIALGDVSGKGTGAALLMSSVHAAVRAQTTTRLSAAEVVSAVNVYIFDNTPANRYVTLFYSELDAHSGELNYINAGHNPPLLVRATGEVTRLDIGGFPVGITPDGEYREGWAKLEPGDVLVIYSDGVTEGLDEAGEEFGEARLIEVVQRHRERTAAGLRDRIDEALTRFVGRAKTVDDVTVVILKRVSAA
jgi:sigma-B regulation protein RsbU (phosphoserine phosphatase)